MPQSSKQVLACKALLVKPIQAGKAVNISSILNAHLPSPLWTEQVEMTHHLGLHVNGVLFSYDGEGWTYIEEGE